MKSKLHSGAHSVHSLLYHLIWCVKYRRKILTNDMGDRLKEFLQSIAEDAGCTIEAAETDIDHIHVLLRLKPTHGLSMIVQRLKGRSAYLMFREYPYLRRRFRKGHLWSPSYYIASVGADKEAVRKYVEGQRAKRGSGGEAAENPSVLTRG